MKNIQGEFRYIGKLFEDNQRKAIELNNAKEKAEESDRLKTAFLMNLSHEIRTPMNAIIGFSNYIIENKLTENEIKENVKIINSSGKNLFEIIDDLLEMSKIESKSIKINHVSFNIKKFIENINKTYSLMYKDSNVNFLCNLESIPDQYIVTDKIKLQEILYNILNNAFKFTDKGQVEFVVNLDYKKNLLIFNINDTGKGIPIDFHDRIFERFVKISSENISGNEGMGLGLAITKAYIDIMNGNISFISTPHKGTSFNIQIPFLIALDHTSNKKQETKLSNIGNQEVILVAEDDNINYLLIEKILKQLNFEVLRATNGLEAVDIVMQNKEVDLILMDIKMPIMNGYEAFANIRKFNTDIPIIAHTSFSFQEEMHQIEEIGFNDCITKPLDRTILLDTLSKYFSR